MSFDFFNTSYLAFGTKITKAFRSLATFLDDANKRLEYVQGQLAYLDQYINKNYRVSTPTSAGAPVRCKEMYDVLKNNPVADLNIQLATTDDVIDGISVRCTIFSPSKYKITNLSGETHELAKGSVYANLSVRYGNFSGTLDFVSLEEEGETYPDDSIYNLSTSRVKLFSFEIVPDERKIILSQLNNYINLIPGAYNRTYSNYQISDITDSITDIELPSRKFLLGVTPVFGNTSPTVQVKFNGQSDYTAVFRCKSGDAGGEGQIRYVPLYLSKGDILRGGSFDKIYEVKYV